MFSLSSQQLLTIWEQGARRHPIDRSLLLFALAAPDISAEQLADVPLGRVNAGILSLYQSIFGSKISALMDCSACGERMEFEADIADLEQLSNECPDFIEVEGLRFRRPTSRHMAKLIGLNNPETAARHLLQECAERPDTLPENGDALDTLLTHVEQAMEVFDPWANLTVEVCCPVCHHEELVTLDMSGILWEEIDERSQRLLDDIHLLAQAYGWSEQEVLALSEKRRSAYIERVQL